MSKNKKAGYRAASRSLAVSFVFIAPLFALYQAGLALDPRVKNGADPIFRELFARFSHLGLVFTNLVLLGLLLIAIVRARKDRVGRPNVYGLMFLEACAWAGLMLLTGQFVMYELLSLPIFPRRLLASCGAGVYEELLFRFLLMGGMILILHRGLGGKTWWVVPVAILASALLFSLAHHELGGEPYDRRVFLYRAGMGMILGGIYWWRGLGIVVYAHALYNVALVILNHVHA